MADSLLFGAGPIVAGVLLDDGCGRSPPRAIERLMFSDPQVQIGAGKSGPILGLVAALRAHRRAGALEKSDAARRRLVS